MMTTKLGSFREGPFPWIRRTGRLLVLLAAFGVAPLLQGSAPVVQLRGTIKEISSSGSRKQGEAPFELNATEEQYSLKVIDSVIEPAGSGYYTSNLTDVFSTRVSARADASAVERRPTLASFRRGSIPTVATAPRGQVLAYAHVALRLPSTGKLDVEFARNTVPALILAAAEMEKCDVHTRLVRRNDGSLERVDFWGCRPGTELNSFQNTRDAFLLGSLVIREAAGTMPLAGVFTVLGKRPGLTGKLVSFERKRYEFSGTIGSATREEAFGWTALNQGPLPKRLTVTDHRFIDEDGGSARSYVLREGDELPFEKAKLPPRTFLVPKPNADRGEAASPRPAALQ